MLANLDMNGFRIQNEGAAVDATDVPNLAQVQTLIGTITKGDKGDPGPAGTYFSTRTALQAYTTHNDYDRVGLTEYGYEGDLIFLTAATFATKTGLTLTTVVTDDPSRGFVIPPSADTTGASGAWVRQGTLLPTHFGCVGSGSVDDTTNLNRCVSLIIKYPQLRHNLTGTFGTNGGLVFGPAATPGTIPTQPIVGRVKLVALTAINEIVRVKNLQYRHWQGDIWTVGTGSGSFASRTCKIGIYFENCARLTFSDGLVFDSLSLSGAYFGTANNNVMDLGYVRGTNIGSGQAGGNGLTGTWTAGSQSGSANSSGQTQLLTGVTGFYDSSFDTYLDVAGQNDPVEVRIGGYLYSVKSFDRVAGTITIFPWLDSTIGSSGTFEWVFGGALYSRTTDANLIGFHALDAFNCGRVITSAAPYGFKGKNVQANACGTGLLLGRNNSAASMGTIITGFYCENSVLEHVVVKTAPGSSFSATVLGDDGSFDLNKCYVISAPRTATNTLVNTELGIAGGGNVTISSKGRLQSFFKKSLTASLGSTYILVGQSRNPVPEVLKADTQTFQMSVQGGGEFNRLLGFSGGMLTVWGTGTNGAPSGTLTFKPPSGGTINGGAVDGTITLTGFAGPVLIIYEHTDAAQLTWKVYVVAGQRLKGSTTWNPPSVAAGANTTTTVTVTGAVLGDAFVASFSLSLAGCVLHAYVSAADTVTVVLQNLTGGAVDLASGTLTATKVS